MVFFEALELLMSHENRNVLLADFAEIHLGTLKIAVKFVRLADDLRKVLSEISATTYADFSPEGLGPGPSNLTLHFLINGISPDHKFIFNPFFLGPNPGSGTSKSITTHISKNTIDIDHCSLVGVCVVDLAHYHCHVASYTIEPLR